MLTCLVLSWVSNHFHDLLDATQASIPRQPRPHPTPIHRTPRLVHYLCYNVILNNVTPLVVTTQLWSQIIATQLYGDCSGRYCPDQYRHSLSDTVMSSSDSQHCHWHWHCLMWLWQSDTVSQWQSKWQRVSALLPVLWLVCIDFHKVKGKAKAKGKGKAGKAGQNQSQAKPLKAKPKEKAKPKPKAKVQVNVQCRKCQYIIGLSTLVTHTAGFDRC